MPGPVRSDPGAWDQRYAHGALPQAGRYADYLLTTPGIRICHFNVPATPAASDHRALILDFDLHAARH